MLLVNNLIICRTFLTKSKDNDISGNKTVLKFLFFFWSISGGSSDIRQRFLDFTLIRMLGIGEGESHSPTPKPVLLFNWTETAKRPYTLYVCIEQHKQTFGKILKFYYVENVIHQYVNLFFFLGHFVWMICPFHQVFHLSRDLQIS